MSCTIATEPRSPRPPLILVTAHSDVPTCKQALNEGAYDYIEKPLDLDHFRAQGKASVSYAMAIGRRREPGEKPPASRDRG